VAKVNPDLVVRNRNGEIYSVRYDQVNAMLLNELRPASDPDSVSAEQNLITHTNMRTLITIALLVAIRADGAS
jgi:hypothetical protein